MSEAIDIEFLDTSPVNLEKGQKVYGWTKLGEELRLASVHQDGSDLVLSESYSSRWQTVFGILTGGIVSALFSAWFRREKEVHCNGDNVAKLVRLSRPAPSEFNWPKELQQDAPKKVITYILLVNSDEGTTDAHVFKLAYKNWLSTRAKYEEAQAKLDRIVLSAVPADKVSDECAD